jgi:hypothetical protein
MHQPLVLQVLLNLAPLGAINFVEFQGTLGVTNFISLGSSSGRSASSIQGPISGT